MESLSAAFSAGTLHWMRFGPSQHPAQRYERVKLSVLLGATTARWRPAKHAPWRTAPAHSVSLLASGARPETEFMHDGQFLALELEGEFISKSLAATPPAQRSRFDLHGVRDPFLSHLAVEAAGLLRRDGALPASYVESLALLASVHIRSHLEKAAKRSPRPTVSLAPYAAERVLAHIETRLDGPLPLAELAAVAGLSTFHFARAFRHSIGESPHRFIVRRRVNFARGLLLHGDSTAAEAAFRAGFSSQSHFTRCCREVCGATPGELLRKKRSNGART